MTIPSARAVGAFGRVAGMRETRKARCGEGPAPCPGPTGLVFSLGVSAANRQPRRLPADVACRLGQLGSH